MPSINWADFVPKLRSLRLVWLLKALVQMLIKLLKLKGSQINIKKALKILELDQDRKLRPKFNLSRSTESSSKLMIKQKFKLVSLSTIRNLKLNIPKVK